VTLELEWVRAAGAIVTVVSVSIGGREAFWRRIYELFEDKETKSGEKGLDAMSPLKLTSPSSDASFRKQHTRGDITLLTPEGLCSKTQLRHSYRCFGRGVPELSNMFHDREYRQHVLALNFDPFTGAV
jgi:hypothetical protein